MQYLDRNASFHFISKYYCAIISSKFKKNKLKETSLQSTFGLVSQGSNHDTCYVGKIQADIMQSYENIVNKTRVSDVSYLKNVNINK